MDAELNLGCKKNGMFVMHEPAHPGEVLREYLPGNMSAKEVAKRLGVSRQALYSILNGQTGISTDMGLRLSQALGTTPDFWLRMQIQWDLWKVREKGVPEVRPFITP